MKKALQSLSKFVKRWYRHLLALPAFFLLFLCFKVIYFSFHTETSDADFKNFLLSDYKLYGVIIPKDLNFCGEKVPIEKYNVKKALEKEFYVKAFFQPQTLILNKKAGRWFPLITPILKKNGVPDDFKFVAVLESGLNNSTKESSAAGFWGLMIPVARDYGLEVDEQVDERFNIAKSTDVACKIFKDGYKKYHSWTLAAASYDLGSGALDKQLEKQNATSYYDMDLNDETAMYIYRLLAFKEIINRPEAYGYKISKREMFAPISTYAVKVDSSITNLELFAISKGSTLQILKTLNPWLLTNELTNPTHKVYEILFLKKGAKLYGMDIINADSIVVPKDTLFRPLDLNLVPPTIDSAKIPKD